MHDIRNRLSTRFDRAVAALMTAAFLTTAAGVATIPPTPTSAIGLFITWSIAIAIAVGITQTIAELAHRLYGQFSLLRFCVLLGISSMAVLFDASWFNTCLLERQSPAIKIADEQNHLSKEYNRVVHETSDIIAQLSAMISARLDQAENKEREAQDHARYETEYNGGCGPICERHQSQALHYRAEIEQLNSFRQGLEQLHAPAVGNEKDLESYYQKFVDSVRLAPFDTSSVNLSWPVAPQPSNNQTGAGNPLGQGGMAYLTELLVDGQFRNPRLLMPLGLGAIVEYLVVLLVIGTREWNPFGVWVRSSLSKIEATVGATPALCELLRYIGSRGLWKEPHSERDRRRQFNQENTKQEDLLRKIRSAQAIDDLLEEMYQTLSSATHKQEGEQPDTTSASRADHKEVHPSRISTNQKNGNDYYRN